VIAALLSGLLLNVAQANGETPADTTTSRKLSIIPVPVIAYTPETKWMFGAYVGMIYHMEDSLRPSSTSIKALYSQRKQFVFGFDPTVYAGAYQISNVTEFLKWPDYFYGIGNDVPDSAEEEYTARIIASDFMVRRELRPQFWAGVRYQFERIKLLAVEPRGMLAAKTLPAPVEGITSGAGVSVSYDTRDNIFFPLTGSLANLSASFYRRGLGSEFSYDNYVVDLRHYLPLTGTHLVAFQIYGSFISGTPHFRHYSVLGGDTRLRGYNGARYRDRQAVYAQAEYRFPIWWRFRGVIFSGAGDVVDEIADFAPRKFKHVVGGGLRFLAIEKEKIYVRLDLGYGINSDGFYLAVSEAF
jgi:hypothetical protein